MIKKQISVSELKARCSEEIRAVEKGDTILELTRHGRKVAVVRPPEAKDGVTDLSSWIGSGKGSVTFGPGYNCDAPAWDSAAWEN